MRVALLCYDLSSNALGRAHILAQACRGFADVEVWGPILGDRVWPPLADASHIQAVHMGPRPRLRRNMRSAAAKIAKEADVVYASKPLATSYGLGRLVRQHHGLPLVLDIDDWELGFLTVGGVQWKVWADGVRKWRQPNSYWPTRRLERVARAEPWKTVSNAFLQQRFGGRIVAHGRDASMWDPARFRQADSKRAFGLEGRRVVLFFGSPRSHKGLDLLVEAVASIPDEDLVCVLAGAAPDDPVARSLQERAPGRVRLIGPQPFDQVPHVVAMADVVAVPQRRNVGSIGQTPAKLFDAMAMQKPILSTKVGDIPQILDGCGVVVEPDSSAALRDGLSWLLDHPKEAMQLAMRARQRFLKDYTVEAMAAILRPIFEKASGAPRTV